MFDCSFFKHRETYIAELISAFYLNSFVILRPILKLYSLVYFVDLFLLLVLYCFFSKDGYDKRRVKIYVLFVIAVLGSMCLEFFFRTGDLIFEYLRSFFIYGIVPAFFLLKVHDVKKFLSFWCFFALLSGIIVIRDPFLGYSICDDYMMFGKCILPAFAAIVVQLFYCKKKFFIFPLVIVLLEIIVFAHKGAVFASLALLLFFILLQTGKKILKLIFLGVGGILFLIFYKWIIVYLIDLSFRLGLNSYSLTGFEKMFLLSAGDEVTNARMIIWKDVLWELENHFALGMGVGNFQAEYNCYPHNFFLDILITYGIPLGFIVFFVVFYVLKSTFLISKNKAEFIFLMTMFLLWFVPMQTSYTYWTEVPFWTFLCAGFYLNNKEVNQLSL